MWASVQGGCRRCVLGRTPRQATPRDLSVHGALQKDPQTQQLQPQAYKRATFRLAVCACKERYRLMATLERVQTDSYQGWGGVGWGGVGWARPISTARTASTGHDKVDQRPWSKWGGPSWHWLLHQGVVRAQHSQRAFSTELAAHPDKSEQAKT